MRAKQYSRIFEKIDKNPSQYKKYYTSIAQQVSAQNFDVIQNIVVQIHDVLANNSRPENKMLAVRLFKDLLPTASYGFMLYSQSYLLNEIVKIIEFKIKGNTDDYQKYLFSNQPDTNLAQVGRSTSAMALESLKFAAETMTLHPYQRLSFPSIFRMQYNRLSSLVRFPETYKFIPETEKTKFHSNYNSRIKDIKTIIKAFQNRLHSRMSFCLSQGNFEFKLWLVKFIYTGQSNIIPFVLNWVVKHIQNPQINTSTKVEMMDFLNEVFVIGDIQIMNQFNNFVIPAMIEIVYPLDYKEFKILNNNHGGSQSLRQRAKECLSFWGQISPQTSQLLQCFSQKSPLLQGSRLYQSYASFAQALQLNIGYRNEINVMKQKFLISKNLSNHLLLLNQFYSKYPVGNEMVFVEEKIVTQNFVPNIPFVQSQQFVHGFRTSDVQLVEEPSQSAINQLSMPGNSTLSKPLSGGYGNNYGQQQLMYNNNNFNFNQQPVSNPFVQSPIITTPSPQMNLDRSQISFSESNISNRIQQLEQMNRMNQNQNMGGVKFMDKVEVMNYEVHNQENPRIFLQKRNLSSHISSRPAEEIIVQQQIQVQVQQQHQDQIQFHDSYANNYYQTYQNNIIKQLYPKTPASEYYEGEQKEYLPSETIIKTVAKPQFKFPVVATSIQPSRMTSRIHEEPMIRRVKSTQMIEPYQQQAPPLQIPHQPYQQQQMPYQQIQQTQIIRHQYFTPPVINAEPILFSRAQSNYKPTTSSLLKKSKSSSNLNGVLNNLNQSMRGLQQRQYFNNPSQFNPKQYHNPTPPNTYEYQQRIKVLQTQVQTCLAVDQIHKQQMRQLKQQLYDVNSKVQHIASLQTFTPVTNIESTVVRNFQPIYKHQIVEHAEVVQSPPPMKLPKQLHLWTTNNPSSKHLDIPPIRTTLKRKKQLMRNKQVLFKSKHCEIGFIMILKDYLEITVYYYFTYPATEFKTQLNSPDLRCIENTNFSYIPYVEGNTQKKQSYRFAYPSLSSLPFTTSEIIVSYTSLNTKQQFKLPLPCIFLKFLTTVQKQPPQYHFNSYHSTPFIFNPLFQRYQNLAQLLPGLIPLNSPNTLTIKEYGVECCYQESTVYVKLLMFRDGFCVIQVYELRTESRSGNKGENLVGTVVEDLISILSTDI